MGLIESWAILGENYKSIQKVKEIADLGLGQTGKSCLTCGG
jgi:hypothetical protein